MITDRRPGGPDSRWRDALSDRAPRCIALPDGLDRRIVAAAHRLADSGLVRPVVVTAESASVRGDLDVRDVNDIAASSAVRAELDNAHRRGVPVDATDPLHAALLLARCGEVDGVVAGATRPTADVVRGALRLLGARPGVRTVSSAFLLSLPSGARLVYGDCGVVPDPSVEQLIDIAVTSADTYRTLVGDEPRVALLSFSTLGSARHPTVDKMRGAVERLHREHPALAVDGELQFDTAFAPDVAAIKAPDSRVAGQANVFVFPNLDAGNIAYKITHRVAGAQALGPLLQGLDGVVHDLSRGCSADDVYDVCLIAAYQSLSLPVGRSELVKGQGHIT